MDFLHSHKFKQILLQTFNTGLLVNQEKLEATAILVEENLGIPEKYRTIIMMKMASGFLKNLFKKFIRIVKLKKTGLI